MVTMTRRSIGAHQTGKVHKHGDDDDNDDGNGALWDGKAKMRSLQHSAGSRSRRAMRWRGGNDFQPNTLAGPYRASFGSIRFGSVLAVPILQIHYVDRIIIGVVLILYLHSI